MKRSGNQERIRLLWSYGKRYCGWFAVAEGCILVSYTVSLLLPQNLARLTDTVFIGGHYDQLPRVIAAYGVLFAVATVFNFLYAYVWQTLKNRYVVDIKNDLFRHAVYAKATYLSHSNSGDLLSRIDRDCDECLNVVQRNLFHFVNSFLLCAGILVMVARINEWVAVILTGAALLPIVLTRVCGRLTERHARSVRETSGRLTGRLFEIVKGFRELRLLGAFDWATGQLLTPLKKLVRLGNRLRRVEFAVNKGTYLVNLTATIGIYGYCAFLVAGGEMTIGSFLAVIEYIALLHRKFNWILRIYLDWRARKASIDRVREVLETPGEQSGNCPITNLDTVEFDHVGFGYGREAAPADETGAPLPDRVLDGVSFTLRRGERVAVVGASGVGKTTLTDLLLRLYDPQEGVVRYNGLPASAYRLDELRRQIGVVSQDVRIFDGTVRYNLTFGREESDDALWTALSRADLKSTVEALPDGLDTMLSADGRGLSGGQKQRLMLARLFLCRASMVILDEATSALDVKTEERVTREVMTSGAQRITLIISHRKTTIEGCDRILLLEEGRVAGVGTHEQLLASSESYRRLFGEVVA